MEEEFITYETALLAKEKGFNLIVRAYYHTNGELEDDDGTGDWNVHDTQSAPTQSLLQKWLREEHNLNIEITPCGYNHKDKHYSFRSLVRAITKTSNVHNNGCKSDIEGDFYIFRSYEKALEAGLMAALGLI
jgi:hypothetical protein